MFSLIPNRNLVSYALDKNYLSRDIMPRMIISCFWHWWHLCDRGFLLLKTNTMNLHMNFCDSKHILGLRSVPVQLINEAKNLLNAPCTYLQSISRLISECNRSSCAYYCAMLNANTSVDKFRHWGPHYVAAHCIDVVLHSIQLYRTRDLCL